MNVLVIGGTGYIGPYVVERLVQRGHYVTVVHRGKTHNALPPSVRTVLGERGSLGILRRQMVSMDLAAVVDIAPYTEAHATELVEVCSGIVPRICMLSSVDVYRAFGIVLGKEDGPLEPTPLTEDSSLRTQLYPYADPTRPADEFYNLYDKIVVEEIVMSAPGMKNSVVRLPMTYGPRDRRQRFLGYVRRMADGRREIPIAKSNAEWVAPRGYVENIADAVALAATHPAAAGRIYHVSDPYPIPEGEWIRMIGRAANWDGAVVTIPDAHLPDSHSLERGHEQSLALDCSRLRAELAYEERVELSESICRTVSYDLQHLPADKFDYSDDDRALAAVRGAGA